MTVKCTSLCYWIARLAKPRVQSSNTSRVRFTVISHTPVCSRFYHIHIVYKRYWDGSCLINLDETCHLKGRYMATVWRTVLLLSCYDCHSTHQHYEVTWFENVLWRRTMHEWVMNIHHQTWIAQGRFINIRTPSKQWGVCDNTKHTHVVTVCAVCCHNHSCRNDRSGAQGRIGDTSWQFC